MLLRLYARKDDRLNLLKTICGAFTFHYVPAGRLLIYSKDGWEEYVCESMDYTAGDGAICAIVSV